MTKKDSLRGEKQMSDTKEKVIAICSAGIDIDYNDMFLRACNGFAEEFHYKLLFFNSFSSLNNREKHDVGEANIFHLINYEMLDGIILLTETIGEHEVCKSIVDSATGYHIPVVSIDSELEGCYNINFEYGNAMEAIVDHIIEVHGCKRINFIVGQKSNSFSKERLEAYYRSLEKHGIPVEKERIGYGDMLSHPVKRIIDSFVESDLEFPEAIICSNDSLALEAYKCLAKAGYNVPEDVLVTGFDGIQEARFHYPTVTTAFLNYKEAIKRAYCIIKDYYEKKPLSEQYWIDAQIEIGNSCGCKEIPAQTYSIFSRELYERLNDYERFCGTQISMTADLTDNDSFQGVFEKLKKYAENFCAAQFWLCIVDDFLLEKEVLADIIEESNFKRLGYSSTMDIMLAMENGEWQGITDFPTASLLPKLDNILDKYGNVMFFPLHVLEQTIGYVAIVYEEDLLNMNYLYQFTMNIGTALETTKTHQRQQAIINNLEIKYIHDPMTGLYNRRGFYQRVTPVFSRCVAEEEMLMVVSVDMNGLKQINDTYGHADGDLAITTIGKAMIHVAGTEYTCARFGGDEFVAAGLVRSVEEAQNFCDRIKQYLDIFNESFDKPYRISASIGMTVTTPSKDITLDEFIKEADERMYRDKVRYHSRRR